MDARGTFGEHERCVRVARGDSYVRRKSALQLKRRQLYSQVKKCLRHVIYARACVNKDFVHSGSIGFYYIGQARALCYKNSFLENYHLTCIGKTKQKLRRSVSCSLTLKALQLETSVTEQAIKAKL